MVLPQFIVVYLLARTNTTLKCRVEVPLRLVKLNPECVKDDFVFIFFTEKLYFYYAIFIAVMSVYVISRSKIYSYRIEFIYSVPCYVGMNIGLIYISGYMAAGYLHDSRIVLVFNSAALTLALIASVLGDKLIDYNDKRRW